MKHILLLSMILLLVSYAALGQERWQAPAGADTLENPYSLNSAEIIAKGKELYMMLCASCHGPEGDGGGGAGQSFDPPPADFTSERVQKQSDGAIFWKIRKGNPPGMLSFGKVLSEEEIWQIVTYLRQFGKE